MFSCMYSALNQKYIWIEVSSMKMKFSCLHWNMSAYQEDQEADCEEGHPADGRDGHVLQM